MSAYLGKAMAAARAVLPIPTSVRSISSVQTMVWLPFLRLLMCTQTLTQLRLHTGAVQTL